jgi:hypothetical protein
VLCPTSIAYHAVQCACLVENFINCGLDGLFFCDICLKGEELVWILFREGSEFVPSLANIDAVDFGGAVGETAVCYAETDS